MKTKPDNICRLKYRLELKDNNVVEFEVLDQDVKLTKTNQLADFKHGDFNGWQIASGIHPDIYTRLKDIYLRGTDKKNDNYVSKFTGDQSTIDSIHKALEEMVRHVYGNCKRIQE